MSALPNIVAAIILIEFSYALAGFMVDFMNILLAFVYEVFKLLQNSGNIHFPSAFSSKSYIFNVFGNQEGNIQKALTHAGPVIGNITSKQPGIYAKLLGMLGKLAGGGLSSIIAFIVAVILLFTAVKIFIKLLKGYLHLMFLPIAGPFFFLIGAFPGQSKFIWKFFTGMLKGVLTFVVVYIMFMVMWYLEYGGGSGNPVSFGNGQSLPLIGFNSAFSSNAGAVMSAFIAIAIFVLIPKLVEDVTKALGYDLSAYSTEFKKNIQGPWGTMRKGASSLMRLAGRRG
jgi:hypothetical protein